MIGWLVYRKQDADENRSYIEWFLNEAEKQGIDLKLIYREQLMMGIHRFEIDGKKVNAPDFVIVRTIEPLLQMQFESINIPVFNNAQTAQICNHKAYTYLEIKQLEIPVMPAVFMDAQAPPHIMPFQMPFILKEATGRSGNNVHMIKNKKQWKDILSCARNKDLIAQSAENVQLGKDVRVFVIGHEIIAAVLRSNSQDFRANFKLGGTASLFELTTDMEKMIHQMITHFEFGLVGIDFLVGKDGRLIFNEIEDVVGSRILSATTNINLLEKYISYIKQRLLEKT